MARTPGSTAENTRALILGSALTLFTTKTYAGTSLQNIAESTGVSKVALYYHFPSKESLLEAMFAPTIQRFGRLVAASTRTDGTVDRIGLVGELVELQIKHAAIFRGLAGDPSVREALRDRLEFDRTIGEITDALTDPSDDTAAANRMRARCAVGAIMWAIMTTARERGGTPPPGGRSSQKTVSDEERGAILHAALDVLRLR
jgi:TetR/AcrR family transcriptional regulator, regulator of cefoperazone and chloramphenicol sensitivity